MIADDQLPSVAQADLGAPPLERSHDRMDSDRKHQRNPSRRPVGRGHAFPQLALACHTAAVPTGPRPKRRLPQARQGAVARTQPPPDTSAPAQHATRQPRTSRLREDSMRAPSAFVLTGLRHHDLNRTRSCSDSAAGQGSLKYPRTGVRAVKTASRPPHTHPPVSRDPPRSSVEQTAWLLRLQRAGPDSTSPAPLPQPRGCVTGMTETDDLLGRYRGGAITSGLFSLSPRRVVRQAQPGRS